MECFWNNTLVRIQAADGVTFHVDLKLKLIALPIRVVNFSWGYSPSDTNRRRGYREWGRIIPTVLIFMNVGVGVRWLRIYYGANLVLKRPISRFIFYRCLCDSKHPIFAVITIFLFYQMNFLTISDAKSQKSILYRAAKIF